MPAAGNSLNYYQGTGKVYWTPEGETAEIWLGNATQFQTQLESETRDHKKYYGGTASIDRTYITSKKGTVTVVLDEIIPQNLELALLGTSSTNSSSHPVISIFAENTKRGALRFEGDNEVGPQYEVTLPLVEFIPSEAFNWIGEEDALITLVGTFTQTGGTFGTAERIADAA